MEMQKLMALSLLCLATTTSVGWCRMVDTTTTQEVTHDQDKQRADAWADWAASKISEGVGASSNGAKDVGQKIMASSKVSVSESAETSQHASEKVNEKLYDVKSHTSEMASDNTNGAMQTGQVRRTMDTTEMADKAKNEASDAYAASGPAMESVGSMASEMADKIKEGAQSAYDFATGKVHVSMGEDVHNAYTYASDKAGQGMSDTSDKASDAMSWASEKAGGAKEVMKEKASGAYDSVSHKTGETVRMAVEEAQESATDKASDTVYGGFEDAREKAYDAYLYMGDKFEGAKEAAAAQGGHK